MTRRATLPALSGFVLCVALAVLTAERLRAQGAHGSFGADQRLPRYEETTELVSVGLDAAGRRQRLEPAAAAAWHEMRRAARADGITLLLVSAFRSVDQQREIFERKLRAGQTLQHILAVNVPPGFSQHHAGTAVDLGTPANTGLLEDFEETAAFQWLQAHARAYGFSMTYPRGNSSGVVYEPWHWAFGQRGA
jgi:zinc D-Ala-D-Ala carboxypeptidase